MSGLRADIETRALQQQRLPNISLPMEAECKLPTCGCLLLFMPPAPCSSTIQQFGSTLAAPQRPRTCHPPTLLGL